MIKLNFYSVAVRVNSSKCVRAGWHSNVAFAAPRGYRTDIAESVLGTGRLEGYLPNASSELTPILGRHLDALFSSQINEFA